MILLQIQNFILKFMNYPSEFRKEPRVPFVNDEYIYLYPKLDSEKTLQVCLLQYYFP